MLTPEETNEDIALVDDREIRTHSGSNFLTTLRYNLKKSALGSLFVSYHASLRSDLQDTFGSGVGAHTGIEARTATRKTAQLDDDSAQDLGRHSPYFVSDIAELSTPTLPSRRQSRRISVPDVKAVISSITGSLGRSRSQSNASSVKSVSSSARGTSRPRLFSITASGSTVTDSTPPLTPSSVFSAACPPCADKPGFPRTYESTPGAEEDEVLSRESLLTSVKEGKKPERSICYDELIADISNDYMQSSPQQQQSDSFDEDSEEWFGLEYTLEISKRDQGAIARASVSAGEYSKARNHIRACTCSPMS
ncbi:hypothetical protein SCP_0205510 [Sparassis crispa]|uniref:Uncharacterized protein n=1 Tax=Sparassis crispa TaxID=139825 RepID=A0A401GB41_9APHY|nr:hypothetical protein SCP_0205510 [Sparassis crispa]GBE79353.1 hypothetical protein SCP_0205510 [Sparassis crispa]